MPQGVFRLRSAVLSAHLTCLSILQTVLPPAALSRFRGTDHSDRIQTLRALPSLCALSTTPEIPAPIQARSPEIRFPRDAQYMKIPRNPTGTLRFSAETRIAGGTSTRSCPRFPSPTDSAEKCGVSAMRVRNQRDAQKPEKLRTPRDKMHPSAPEDFSKFKKNHLTQQIKYTFLVDIMKKDAPYAEFTERLASTPFRICRMRMRAAADCAFRGYSLFVSVAAEI